MFDHATKSQIEGHGGAKSFPIFRAGDFVSAEGKAVSFTAADLQAIADSYDASKDPAPLVVGHPRLDHPAYGWVGKLEVEGDALVARADQVEPSFAETVNAGRYRKISAQFYPPEHSANPVPGQYYLKHVGFLGAHAPAVKGLGTVSLGAGDVGDLFTIEQENVMATADKDKEASFAEQQSALDTRAKDLDAREAKIAQAARDARHEAAVSFAEGMIKDAKLAPAGKPLLVGVLDALGDGDVVSFGEAGELAPRDALVKLLDQAAPLVSLGEAAADKGDKQKALASFAAPAGYDVDPDQAAIFAKAKAIQADNPKLAWMDCVRRAQS